eukprot:1494915-Rhodomonas_salina.1
MASVTNTGWPAASPVDTIRNSVVPNAELDFSGTSDVTPAYSQNANVYPSGDAANSPSSIIAAPSN